MDSFRMSNPESEPIPKFYERIRLHLDDIEPPMAVEATSIRDRLKDVKEEDSYGLISRPEFEAILQAYDDQSEKPTKCDRFEAGSFAKLLYSKPGFHHPAATAYLVSELKLKDKNRDSFLGGHSTYKTTEDYSITTIRKFQQKMYIRERTKELLDAMETAETPFPGHKFEKDIDELSKMDSQNANVLAVSGRYNMKIRYNDLAIQLLEKAENLGCDHIELLKKYLSEALYDKGVELFSSTRYEQALDAFIKSSAYDRTNSGSTLHTDMCLRKIGEQRRPIGCSQNTFLSRRK